MADYYDHSYRQLFSHPELIRDLLEGFVHEEGLLYQDLMPILCNSQVCQRCEAEGTQTYFCTSSA